MDFGIERRWRGGEGYATDLRFGIGLEQSLGRYWRVGTLGRLWVTGYDEGDDETEPWGRSLDLYAARRFGPGWLTVGGHLSRETPKRSNLRWTSRGTSVRYAANVGRDWSLSVRAGLSRTEFDREASLFLVRRKDRTYTAGITASHRGLAWKGDLPELTLNWSRTASNIPLYNRKTRTLRLALRRLF